MLVKKVNNIMIDAMKARDSLVLGRARLLKAALEAEATSLRSLKTPRVMNEEDELRVVRGLVKKGQDAAVMFRDGGNADKAAETLDEAQWYGQFLPAAASDEDVEAVITKAVAEGLKLGDIMSLVKSTFGGAADMKKASRFAAALLK